jgi:dihydroorotate dehydrogenase (NAD+) catalytic subunit
VEAWLEDDLPDLVAAGARVVASIWGRTVDDYAKAASALADAPDVVVAVEVNLSCPNLDGGAHLFAQSRTATAEAIEASAAAHRPLWAKLTPNVTDIVEIAAAAADAGAAAVTLVNTLFGMAIDVESRQYRLGAGGGGLSGPAIHAVAVRAVHDVHAARPEIPIVGVGGVSSGEDAVELMMAGATAVQVGTATFADPRAPWRVLDDLGAWCGRHGVARVADVVGAVHDRR